MTTRKTILIAEDERDLAELMALNLNRAGFLTRVVHNGRAALAAIATEMPDLLILDLMMPELSGTEVASRIRSDPKTNHLPIVMVTAKAEEMDQLVGLSVGADDYVTKPFSMKVLQARLEAVLRRTRHTAGGSSNPHLGPIEVNLETHEIRCDGDLMKLTLTEFRLLASLVQANGRVLSRATLMSKAMGPGVMVTERTIDVHITSIRKKLGASANLVRTVRGVGYRASLDAEPGDEAGTGSESFRRIGTP
jgi:two-component system phosphate regulon response regulator PhoB